MTHSIVSKLLEASNKIHKVQMKGTGNFIVTSPYFYGTIRKELRKEKIKHIFYY